MKEEMASPIIVVTDEDDSMTINDRFLRYVSGLLQEQFLTGQIVLHANRGDIRKIECRQFVNEHDLTSPYEDS